MNKERTTNFARQNQNRYFIIALKYHQTLLITIFFSCVIIFTSNHKFIYLQNKYKVRNASLYFNLEIGRENFLIYTKENNADIDLIHYPGNGYNKNYIPGMIKFFNGLHINHIFPIYRGYGPSKGVPNEINFMIDINILADIIKKRNKKVVLFGFSLGCAFSLYFNMVYGDVFKIILINPFYSIDSMISESYKGLEFLKYLVTDKYENCKRITKYNRKILFFLCEKDTIVSTENTKRLKKITKSGKIVIIPDSDHNEFIDKGGIFVKNFYHYVFE